jgi:hypothetical protein
MNWIISEADQKALDNDRYLNIALAILGPDCSFTREDVEYLLATSRNQLYLIHNHKQRHKNE